MENQSPSNIASSALSRLSDAPDDRDKEIAKLKERLGFYESFDQIIQENVARAGDLLRHAVSVREGADEAVNNATKDLEQRRLSERQEQRALLSGLLDDVTTMQVHVERLARKVADALDDIEATLPAGPDLESLPGGGAEPIAALVAPSEADQGALALDPTPEELAPEDLSVIAARLAAERGPLETETAAVAAEVVSLSSEDSAVFESEQFELPDINEAIVSTSGELPLDEDPATATEEADSTESEVVLASDQAEEGVADLPVAEDSVFGSELTNGFIVHSHGNMPEVELLPSTTGEVPAEGPETWIQGDETGTESEASPLAAYATEDSLPELEFAAETDEDGSSSSIEDYLREHESSGSDEVEAIAEDVEGLTSEHPDLAAEMDDQESESISEEEEAQPSEDNLGLLDQSLEIPAESAFDETGYLTTLPQAVRSLSTDELFLATDVDPTAILPSSVAEPASFEVAPSAEDDEEIPATSAEEADQVVTESEGETVSESAGSTEEDSASEVIDSVAADFGDADTIVQAVEQSSYSAAVPAALAEDPDIDSALSESLAHVEESDLVSGIESIAADAEIPSSEIEEAEAPGSEHPSPTPDARPFPAGGLGTAPRPSTAELRSAALSRFTLPTTTSSIRGIGTVVLVHGVPRATTALSLKRYLESLQHVSSVEPREYAEGILRLHVTAERSIHIDDLRGWSDGAGFEPVHLRDDLVEVRLPH